MIREAVGWEPESTATGMFRNVDKYSILLGSYTAPYTLFRICIVNKKFIKTTLEPCKHACPIQPVG